MSGSSRRSFFSRVAGIGAATGLGLPAVALAQEAPATPSGIPLRQFGRHADVKISALGLGGHHLGNAASVEDATAIAHEAIDGGIQYFDNAWEYNNHRSEEWMGAALAGGYRDKVFLMTKVCTHGRDAAIAMRQLEESLQRLRTDHLDLWQVHAVTYDNDPDLAYRTNGVLEALDKAKAQGKVRFTGFTGHKDPHIHYRMLTLGYPFDAIQFPINPFDAQFRSFQKLVLPEAVKRGVAVIGMKPFTGAGNMFHRADVDITPEEAMLYAMNVPGVTLTVTGMETLAVLRQNLAIAQKFRKLSADQLAAIERRVAPVAGDGRYEVYKTSLSYDDIVTRQVHEMPLAGARA